MIFKDSFQPHPFCDPVIHLILKHSIWSLINTASTIKLENIFLFFFFHFFPQHSACVSLNGTYSAQKIQCRLLVHLHMYVHSGSQNVKAFYYHLRLQPSKFISWQFASMDFIKCGKMGRINLMIKKQTNKPMFSSGYMNC